MLIIKRVCNVNYDFTTLAFSAYKQKLVGLPSFCRLVMLEIFEYFDPQSGTISLDSLERLANDYFQVDPIRGRQKELINGDTIRNAFRSIKKAKSEHFKFNNINQRIVIDMPFIRELHQSVLNKMPEVAENLAVIPAFTQLDKSTDFEAYVAAEPAAATSDSTPVKNNNYLNKNKTNNNKHDTSKSFISDSFFPSAETLIRAKAKGFDNADDLSEIQAFIDHNKAIGSQWVDFNPIYLRWLENGKDRKTRQITEKSGRVNNGSSCKTYKKSPKQRVIDAYSNEFDYCEQTGRFYEKGTETFNEKPEPQPIKYIDIDSLGPID